MTDDGELGGLYERRDSNQADAFELTINQIFGERMRTDDVLCRQIWSALANVTWYQPASHATASYSFRGAGDLIAAICESGTYLDWYCCGPYGEVTELIRRSMKKAGWLADTTAAICDAPGCLQDVSCGWPSEAGYRMTCSAHYVRQCRIETPAQNGTSGH